MPHSAKFSCLLIPTAVWMNADHHARADRVGKCVLTYSSRLGAQSLLNYSHGRFCGIDYSQSIISIQGDRTRITRVLLLRDHSEAVHRGF
jgi:hypothetical protein